MRDRLFAKVARADIGCWEWTAAKDPKGYGRFQLGRGQGTRLAHRLVYETLVGPIPEGLDLDHLCRNTSCVRPDHLEPVTRGENTMRGDTLAARKAAQTHCIRGHEFTEENTYRAKNGTRSCRECHRITQGARYHANKVLTGATA